MFSKVKVALFGGKLNGFHVISLTDHLEDSIKGEDEGKTLKSKITKFSFSKNPDLLMFSTDVIAQGKRIENYAVEKSGWGPNNLNYANTSNFGYFL